MAGVACSSGHVLPPGIPDSFFRGYDGVAISSNARHYVRELCDTSSCARWEVKFARKFLDASLVNEIDWDKTVSVWHPDQHFGSGFTSTKTPGFRTYIMKALHGRLLVAERKRRYDKGLHLVWAFESSDHTFECAGDILLRKEVVSIGAAVWREWSGSTVGDSRILQDLCALASKLDPLAPPLDNRIYAALMKGFVFKSLVCDAAKAFRSAKSESLKVIEFVRSLVFSHRELVWSHRMKSRVECERNGTLLVEEVVGSVASAGTGSRDFSLFYIGSRCHNKFFSNVLDFADHYLFRDRLGVTVSVV
ncbi:hypothetical protein G9A89_003322 [Geosiphon pyriformis]|nr:hypothetical protein G9A89_003322 [Geosiphon pyriformis]